MNFDISSLIKNAMGGYTQEQLEAAFDLVAPAGDWKGPIDATIPRDKQEVVGIAVAHFSGTEAEFECAGDDRVRVTAIGYRMGPAGP